MTPSQASDPSLLAPENAVKLLGVIPLFQISKIYDVPYDLLARKRDELGRPPVLKMPGPVPKALIPLLGFVVDDVLAVRFFLPVKLVTRIREAYGIPPIQLKPLEMRKLIEIERDSLYFTWKGIHPDFDLARHLEISARRVPRHRKELGSAQFRERRIPKHSNPKKNVETQIETRSVSTFHHPLSNLKTSWSVDEIKLLGTMHDWQLAALLHLYRFEIADLRRKLCIPPFKTKNPIPVDKNLLGTMRDSHLAQLTGRTTNYIRQLRKKYHIDEYSLPLGNLIYALNHPK
jgi:hypothetical protein